MNFCQSIIIRILLTIFFIEQYFSISSKSSTNSHYKKSSFFVQWNQSRPQKSSFSLYHSSNHKSQGKPDISSVYGKSNTPTSSPSSLSSSSSPTSPTSMNTNNELLPTLDYITFVSGNNLKKVEVDAILTGSIPCKLLFDAVEFDEPQANPVEISQAKCRQAVDAIKGPCLVEDTSLCFNALNGLPGPYIKWFIESLGSEGLPKLLDAFEDKSAYAQCVVSFSLGVGHEVITFVGVSEGDIVVPHGAYGFGWDAVFQPKGHNITFAEMTKEQKNTLSHRFRAMSKFKNYMNQHYQHKQQTGSGDSTL